MEGGGGEGRQGEQNKRGAHGVLPKIGHRIMEERPAAPLPGEEAPDRAGSQAASGPPPGQRRTYLRGGRRR
ncbi:MAG: hypothetical protein Kow0092_08520 [Deferrisomatales bacterium]